MTPEFTYKAKLVRVLDGDTAVFDIDLGFYLTTRLPVRLMGINAPELNQAGGQDAKVHLTMLLSDGEFVLKSYKPRDKYGRYLAVIYKDGINLNQLMVADKHAVDMP